jgi:hypothetical protein
MHGERARIFLKQRALISCSTLARGRVIEAQAQIFPGKGCGLCYTPEILKLGETQTQAKLTGTPTARGLFVTFLTSRPLKWGFRMFFRSNFATFRPWGPGTTNLLILSTPPSISGWPHHLNPIFLKIAKTQKP